MGKRRAYRVFLSDAEVARIGQLLDSEDVSDDLKMNLRILRELDENHNQVETYQVIADRLRVLPAKLSAVAKRFCTWKDLDDFMHPPRRKPTAPVYSKGNRPSTIALPQESVDPAYDDGTGIGWKLDYKHGQLRLVKRHTSR